MTFFALSRKERNLLAQVIGNTKKAQTLRRAQALLWLDEGESASEVADLLGVCRSVIYKWAGQFEERAGLDMWARVSDGARSGRPRTVHGIIDHLIDEVIDLDPRELGYRWTVWTAPLLGQYLVQRHQIAVSIQSIRLAIHRLRIRWKRPRHTLSRRCPTWRQAKGGSSAGSRGGCGRSF
jgi:transposase